MPVKIAGTQSNKDLICFYFPIDLKINKLQLNVKQRLPQGFAKLHGFNGSFFSLVFLYLFFQLSTFSSMVNPAKPGFYKKNF